MPENVLSVFSSKSFIISSLTFRALIHFEFTFVYGVRECSNFTFALFYTCSSHLSQHHLLKWLFFIIYSFILCQSLSDQRSLSLFMDFLLCSTDLYFCFCVSTMLFNYCHLVVHSEIREPDFPTSVIALATWVSWASKQIVNIFCSNLEKMPLVSW